MLPHLTFRPLHNSASSLFHPQDALGLDSQRATLVGLKTLDVGIIEIYAQKKNPTQKSWIFWLRGWDLNHMTSGL